jgi:hypothetical protein
MRRGTHVDHHDLVAEAVHFDKKMVGECAHASILRTNLPYMPDLPYMGATIKSPAGSVIV